MDDDRPTNRLARETSPYLLQHAHNPVDWYPWGAEALERARAENKPIFLSVGYSACHWCHVMERECFEDEDLAAVMNAHFVNVKVDREERPDVDELYMKAVTALTGQGGWPMSVFLTPDLRPFYGGTYFPPVSRHGLPGFDQVLGAISTKWREDPALLVDQGARMAAMISKEATAPTRSALAPDVLDRALAQQKQQYDPEWGGFGQAPKFPHAADVRLCLRHALRTGDPEPRAMALTTLDRMAEGGIHDQLGGGFHRYSTDERWLIPHFEKMLYDNAQLVPAYLEAFQVTGAARYSEVARDVCDWVVAEMVTPEGGFASTQDADTEGEEGRFFVWDQEELEEVLGAELGHRAAAWFGVTLEGNFEGGRSALWRHAAPEVVAAELGCDVDTLAAQMAEARRLLFAAREERERPATDDKVLAGWNGLMIAALARAAVVLGEPRYLDAARGAATYVLEGLRRPDGRLFATARHGHAHLDGYLDDHAFVIAGLIELHQADLEPSWLRSALELHEVLVAEFSDPDQGGYFTVGRSSPQLIARLKNHHDGALPAGNAVHVDSCLRLAALTGRDDLEQEAERVIESVGELANRHPSAFSTLLAAVQTRERGLREVVVSGERGAADTEALLAVVRGRFDPALVVALADGEADEALLPIVAGRAPAGPARAFVCSRGRCGLPAADPAELERQLGRSTLGHDPG